MHILLIHQGFVSPTEPGGTRHLELARHLVEWGHRVTIVCSQVSYLTGIHTGRHGRGIWTTTNESGIQMRWVRVYAGHHRSYLHRSLAFLSFSLGSLVAATANIRPDLVIGTSPPPLQSYSALLAAKWHRRPFVFEIRDLFWEYAIQTGAVKADLLVGIARHLDNWLCHQSDHIIVNSPGFIPYLIQRGNVQESITLIPNSVDPEQFSPEKAQRSVWNSYGCQDRYIVLYAGAFGMLNNLDALVDAARCLRDHPEICICLMGDGKERSALMRQVQDAELTNIIFVPSQPKAEVPAFVASADACVATLRDLPILRTVYPNKVFDYMAAGRPIVLAIDGEIRRVLEEADAGIYVPPGNSNGLAEAILMLYSDRKRAESMGQNGRNYVVRYFNRVDQAKKLENLLLKVVASHQ